MAFNALKSPVYAPVAARPSARVGISRAATLSTYKTTLIADYVIPAAGTSSDAQVESNFGFWIGQVIFLADDASGTFHSDPEGVGTWMQITGGVPPLRS